TTVFLRARHLFKGLIWDSQGRVLHAFVANFGLCSIARAELRVAIHGLSLAWDMSFWKVYLQMDSSRALDFLLGNPPDDARHGSSIRVARQLLARNWEVSASHIYREGNNVADLLAHHGHSMGFGFHILPSFPRTVFDCIQADMAGILFHVQFRPIIKTLSSRFLPKKKLKRNNRKPINRN
ncbi:Putative ribonuclease H protein At1g65750, partial [Linum grandiflorum]